MSEYKITVLFCLAVGVVIGAMLKSFWIGVSAFVILFFVFERAWYLEYIETIKAIAERGDTVARPRDLQNAVEYEPLNIDEPANGVSHD